MRENIEQGARTKLTDSADAAALSDAHHDSRLLVGGDRWAPGLAAGGVCRPERRGDPFGVSRVEVRGLTVAVDRFDAAVGAASGSSARPMVATESEEKLMERKLCRAWHTIVVLLAGTVVLIGVQFGCAELVPDEPAKQLAASQPAEDNPTDSHGLSWDELSPTERAAWSSLGWNPSSWEGQGVPPASEQTAWRDLTSTQRMAAQEIGCTELSWDALPAPMVCME
jgi:hypothetical protein